MATCMYCNSQIPDGLKFCTNCGAALPVEAPIEQTVYDTNLQQSYQQPAYQQPSQQPNQQPYSQAQPTSAAPAVEDSGSIGWAILGFIIPIVGIILFFVWMKTKPKCAQMALTGAVISIVLGFILRFSGALFF